MTSQTSNLKLPRKLKKLPREERACTYVQSHGTTAPHVSNTLKFRGDSTIILPRRRTNSRAAVITYRSICGRYDVRECKSTRKKCLKKGGFWRARITTEAERRSNLPSGRRATCKSTKYCLSVRAVAGDALEKSIWPSMRRIAENDKSIYEQKIENRHSTHISNKKRQLNEQRNSNKPNPPTWREREWERDHQRMWQMKYIWTDCKTVKEKCLLILGVLDV